MKKKVIEVKFFWQNDCELNTIEFDTYEELNEWYDAIGKIELFSEKEIYVRID